MAPNPSFGPVTGSATTTNSTPVDVAGCAIPDGCIVVLESTIAAKSGNLNGAGYTLTATFKAKAGVVTQVGAGLTALINEDAALASCTVGWNISGNSVRVRCTGINATTIDWSVVTWETQV